MKDAMTKILPANYDVNHYYDTLKLFEPNKWFAPTNNNGSNEFTICSQLAEYNLICKATIPMFLNGNHVGNIIQFLYNEDMNYKLLK